MRSPHKQPVSPPRRRPEPAQRSRLVAWAPIDVLSSVDQPPNEALQLTGELWTARLRRALIGFARS